jgi:hypothetical protein
LKESGAWPVVLGTEAGAEEAAKFIGAIGVDVAGVVALVLEFVFPEYNCPTREVPPAFLVKAFDCAFAFGTAVDAANLFCCVDIAILFIIIDLCYYR